MIQNFARNDLTMSQPNIDKVDVQIPGTMSWNLVRSVTLNQIYAKRYEMSNFPE